MKKINKDKSHIKNENSKKEKEKRKELSKDHNIQKYYHGTKADLKIGDLIKPGFNSNYGKRKKSKFIYLTATLDAAIWVQNLLWVKNMKEFI